MDQAGARAYFSIQSEGGVNAVIGALPLNPTCLYFEILKKMLLRRNVFAFIYGVQVALSFTDANIWEISNHVCDNVTLVH